MRAIAYDFDNVPQLTHTDVYMTLSRKDVLGIVQSAFDEMGPNNPELVEIKRQVLSEVSEGKLAHALRSAIIGAGKARGANGC